MEKWPKLVFPKELNSNSVVGEVFKIDGDDDIKPSLVAFNEKEMVMFTNHLHREYPSHFSKAQIQKNRLGRIQHTVMYRTEDGGKSWECCGHVPFHDGYEASATVIDGVIYVQTHEFPNLFSDHDNLISRVFCSEDKGHSWYETRVDNEFLGVSDGAYINLNRNFIRLSDGSIAGFVTVYRDGPGYTIRMTTMDHGRTWKKDRVMEYGVYSEDCNLAPLVEAFFFRTPKSNRLLAISRVVWSQLSEEQIQQIPHAVPQGNNADIDSFTGMLLLESKDEGLSWYPVRGLGYLCMMYPSVAFLNEEDFLLTYTLRSNTVECPYPHMGMQAILGKELPDGSFNLDFNHDIIVIDDRTPDYSENGGSFGTTSLLPDGSFITPYSYRINVPVLDEKMRESAFNDENVFMSYYQKTKVKRDHIPTIDHYREASFDLRRHQFTLLAEERMESFCQTEVLKWKLVR